MSLLPTYIQFFIHSKRRVKLRVTKRPIRKKEKGFSRSSLQVGLCSHEEEHDMKVHLSHLKAIPNGWTTIPNNVGGRRIHSTPHACPMRVTSQYP